MSLPIYNDGQFELFEMVSNGAVYEEFTLKSSGLKICYRENSVGDKLKYELSQGNVEITTKITIPQYKKITSRNVLLIDDEYHKVYNTYHFEDKEGNKETTLTLERYNL